MRLATLRILLLLVVGLAFVSLTTGWALLIHVHACDHAQDGCDHSHSKEGSQSKEHDSDSCTLCQHLAVVSKQVIVSQTPASVVTLTLHTSVASIHGAVFPQDTARCSSPRAPPMICA